MKWITGGVTAPKGFVANGIHCGIRKNQSKKDLAIVYSEKKCAAAAVYTQNKVYGAPITVTRANLADGFAKAIIVNSGNANTCNGDGVEKAQMMCDLVGEALGIAPSDVVVASTGIIGQTLDITPIQKGIKALTPVLSETGGHHAAQAILTTDLKAKEKSVEIEIGGKTVTIGACAKGSGMIHPNMATMLGFITTDAAITPEMLQKSLSWVVNDTFNMISVDGDTSTNDMVTILANGQAENPVIDSAGEAYDCFTKALLAVSTELSMLIAGDGEGAQHLIVCNVVKAPQTMLAKNIAKSVICSSLVKTAIFGSDANWGRILCAIGYTPGEFLVDRIDVFLSSSKGKIQVCKDGFGVAFSEAEAKTILQQDMVTIDIDMNQGESMATAWGCDLTYDYVKINGDYRT